MSSSVTLPSVQGSRLAITIKNATFGYCINPNGPTTGLLILVIMLGLLCSLDLDLDLDLERLALIGAMALVALVLAQRLSSPPVQESQRSWTWAPIGIIKSYLRWARLLISPNADCPPTQESNDISSFGVTLQSSATAPTATTVPTTVTMTPHSPRELAIVVYDPTKASINTNWQTGSMAVSTVADITPAFAATRLLVPKESVLQLPRNDQTFLGLRNATCVHRSAAASKDIHLFINNKHLAFPGPVRINVCSAFISNPHQASQSS